MTFIYTKEELFRKIENTSTSDDDVCELFRSYIFQGEDDVGSSPWKIYELYVCLVRCNPNRLKCVDFLYNLAGYFSIDTIYECLIYLNTELFTYYIGRNFEMEWNTYNLFKHVNTYFEHHKAGKEKVYREIAKMFKCLLLHSQDYFYTKTPFIREYSERRNGRYFKNMGPDLSYLYTYITNKGITEVIDFVITEYTNGKADDYEGEWWLTYVLSNTNLCEILVRDKITHANIDTFDNHWTRLVTKQIEYANKCKDECMSVLHTAQNPFLLSVDVITYCIFPMMFP